MEAIAPKSQAQAMVDKMQSILRHVPQVEMPLTHRFTPGLYIREIFMPKGSFVISRTHKFEHPYVVSKGDVSVWTEGEGVVRIKAPHTGITTPGTRRLLFMHEDTIWTTFHVTNERDPEKIVEQVTEPVKFLELDPRALAYVEEVTGFRALEQKGGA